MLLIRATRPSGNFRSKRLKLSSIILNNYKLLCISGVGTTLRVPTCLTARSGLIKQHFRAPWPTFDRQQTDLKRLQHTEHSRSTGLTTSTSHHCHMHHAGHMPSTANQLYPCAAYDLSPSILHARCNSSKTNTVKLPLAANMLTRHQCCWSCNTMIPNGKNMVTCTCACWELQFLQRCIRPLPKIVSKATADKQPCDLLTRCQTHPHQLPCYPAAAAAIARCMFNPAVSVSLGQTTAAAAAYCFSCFTCLLLQPSPWACAPA